MPALYAGVLALSIRQRIVFSVAAGIIAGMTSDLAQSLRTAIAHSGMGHNELARAVDIPQPTITRFLNGADMKLSTAAKLAEYFGLELRPAKRRRSGGAERPASGSGGKAARKS